jgi:hypothetical protein
VWLTGRSVDVSGELYNCGIESYKLEHNRLLISCSELDYVNV